MTGLRSEATAPRLSTRGIPARMSYLAAMLKTGSPAPDFSLLDDEGNQRTLADFAGKTLVLWFYPKADTPG